MNSEDEIALRKKYINPDRTKPWNQLPLLPPPQHWIESTEIFQQLTEARAALSELNTRAELLPNQAMLINTLPLQEAKDSSEIENIFTTNDELYKAYSKSLNYPETVKGAEKEVLMYREALWEGFKDIKERRHFDLTYLIKIYQIIKDTNQVIRPPFNPVNMRKSGNTLTSGEIVYTPPRGTGILEDLLNNLFEFINDDAKYAYDPLIKLAICHYQFEAIHPFTDGNGRTGRMMAIHLLIQKNLLNLPILYLSKYILDTKNDYYYYLGEVSQRASWKNWIVYILRGITVTARNTIAKIKAIKELEDSTGEYIQSKNPKLYSEDLTRVIFSQPYATVNNLVQMKVGVENTVRKYLNDLADLKVLEKKTIGGHHFYLNQSLMDLLQSF